jgi:hypothetical protein
LYIGTDTSREMASTGSPRNRRSTTSFFRCADQRFTSAAARSTPSVALRARAARPANIPASGQNGIYRKNDTQLQFLVVRLVHAIHAESFSY